MKTELKKQILIENCNNYNSNADCESTLYEYVKAEAENDPNFFRWLFDDDSLEDFGSNLNDEKEEEYSAFLYTMITTLDELAQYINNSEDYPMDTENIVKANGWTPGTNEFDVCKNDGEVLTMDENSGTYVVKPCNWGGKREGAGRKTLYSEKKPVKIYLTAEAVELLNAEQKKSNLSRSDVVNKIVLEYLKSEA